MLCVISGLRIVINGTLTKSPRTEQKDLVLITVLTHHKSEILPVGGGLNDNMSTLTCHHFELETVNKGVQCNYVWDASFSFESQTITSFSWDAEELPLFSPKIAGKIWSIFVRSFSEDGQKGGLGEGNEPNWMVYEAAMVFRTHWSIMTMAHTSSKWTKES